MKLNNKGFAISSIMYIILVMAILLMVLILSLISGRKLIIDKLKSEVLSELYITTSFNGGNYYKFVAPKTGEYKFQLWGSAGNEYGGNGAYTEGNLVLNKGDVLYVVVGDQNGYNGGGHSTESSRTGGGATDVRLELNGDITSFESLKSRIMVAAGGGTVTNNAEGAKGGSGGALTGINGVAHSHVATSGDYIGYGATQTNGGSKATIPGSYYITSGSFGKGGSGGIGPGDLNHYGSGGGGGYYGGGGSAWHAGSGGGSSFISGHSGCNAISSTSTVDAITHTGATNHYSGYVFTNTIMKSGDEQMPSFDGNSTMLGNTSSGYAKITYLG